MANQKNRLGRGLGSLISGGLQNQGSAAIATKSAPKSVAKKKSMVAVGSNGVKKTALVQTKKTTTKRVPSKASAVQPKTATQKSKPAPESMSRLSEVVQPLEASAIAKPAHALVALEPSSAKDEPFADKRNRYLELPLGQIIPNPHQPRRDIRDEHIRELADSIRSEGLLQPIVVRKQGDVFEIIAGERRWRACRSLELSTIPARVLEVGDTSSAVIALIENLQREGLNAIEEALGYACLMRDFDLTQESVSERVGKARASVANALRLLQLDSEIQGYVSKGMLSSGHAKVLLSLEDPAQRLVMARRIVEMGMSVRDTERAVRRVKAETTSSRAPSRAVQVSQVVADLERDLASRLNTKVTLKHTPKKGRLIIEYYGNEDLQRILEKTGLAD
jgi:ParB family chromosome partitioning protein